MFDIKLLYYFVAVAEEHSFSRAAERLHVAQPWLSRQIRKLEEQVGFSLFERTTRRVAVTERGERLLERARLAVSNADATVALARALADPDRPTLRFGVPPYALFVEARTALFDRFMAETPSARLDVEIGKGERLVEDLAAGAVDAVFAIANPRTLAGPELATLELCCGGVDIVIPKDDPLAQRKQVRTVDLAGRKVAAFSRRANGDLFDLVYGGLDASGIRFTEFSDYGFFRHLAERGLVTALPSWQPAPVGGVVRRPFADAQSPIALHLIRHKANTTPLLDAFWRAAEQTAAIAA